MKLDLTPREAVILTIGLGLAHAGDHADTPEGLLVALGAVARWNSQRIECKEVHALLDKLEEMGTQNLPLDTPLDKSRMN
jgi:hypothetical protein